MKMQVQLPDGLNLEIEGDPQEVGALLNLLRNQGLGQAKTQQPAKPEPSPKQRRLFRPEPTHYQTAQTTAPQNRRQMVLNAFKRLRQNGVLMPRIQEIVAEVSSQNPGATLKYLDQVIRDLANKTTLVSSPQRGRYCLTEQETH